MLSAAMLLDWLGRRHHDEKLIAAARVIDASIDAALQKTSTRTTDLGGPLSTTAFTSELCKEIDARPIR
jgi:3-isopropylmalate dehydrogenase